MLSILMPTRERPRNLKRFLTSLMETAAGEVEVVCYIDEDDHSYDNMPLPKWVTMIHGPRIVLSEMWNECYKVAKGPYYMHCGDDIIFRTFAWDEVVIGAFPEDKIAFVHGNDGVHNERFGTHGFLHKNWVEATGYFVPPYFSSDFNDTWLNDVANALGRRIHVPILTEHMHYSLGKAEIDQNTLDRLQRHKQDNVQAKYASLADKRQEDVEKLRQHMA